MNILLNILLISLFILSCEINYHEAEKELTNEQKEYAQNIVQQPGIQETHWKNKKTLEVTLGPGFFKNSENDNSRVAEMYAEKLAEYGFEYIGLEICIEILDTNKESVSYNCYSY